MTNGRAARRRALGTAGQDGYNRRATGWFRRQKRAAMTYQVSYVIRGERGAGKIAAADHYPEIGEEVELAGRRYRIIEVEDLIPPRAEVCYVHVLCEPA